MNDILVVPPKHKTHHSSLGVGAQAGASQAQTGNVLLLAYYYILQAVNDQQQSAQIHAKQERSNASAQAKLVCDEKGIGFYQVPTFHQQYTWVKGSRYIKESFGLYNHMTWGYHMIKVPKSNNDDKVLMAQFKNQEQQKIRESISSQLIGLRQNAQTQQAEINTVVNNLQQSVQQGIKLLNMLAIISKKIMGD